MNKTIEQYEEEATLDIKIDINKLEFHMTTLSQKKIKWGRYLYDEELKSSFLDTRVKEIYKKLFYKYSYEVDESIDKKNIETYIKADKEYSDTIKLFNAQKSKEKFVNEILKILEQHNFLLNNIIKHIIFQAGG